MPMKWLVAETALARVQQQSLERVFAVNAFGPILVSKVCWPVSSLLCTVLCGHFITTAFTHVLWLLLWMHEIHWDWLKVTIRGIASYLHFIVMYAFPCSIRLCWGWSVLYVLDQQAFAPLLIKAAKASGASRCDFLLLLILLLIQIVVSELHLGSPT